MSVEQITLIFFGVATGLLNIVLFITNRQRFLIYWAGGYLLFSFSVFLRIYEFSIPITVLKYIAYMTTLFLISSGVLRFAERNWEKWLRLLYCAALIYIILITVISGDEFGAKIVSYSATSLFMFLSGIAFQYTKSKVGLFGNLTGVLLIISAFVVGVDPFNLEEMNPVVGISAGLGFASSMSIMVSYFISQNKELRDSRNSTLETQEYLKSLLRSLDGLVFSYDLEGRFVDFFVPEAKSLKKEDRLFIPPEKFIGRRYSEVLPEELVEKMGGAFSRAVKGSVEMLEYPIDLDSDVEWYESFISPRYNGRGSLLGFTSVSRNVSELKRGRLEIEKRERLLRASAEVVKMLVDSCVLDESIQESLAVLGRATEVNRVYIFVNHTDRESGEMFASHKYEWTDGSVKSEIGNTALQNVPYRWVLNRWYELLNNGREVMGLVKDFPQREREDLEPQGIISLLAVPITIDGLFWGFIGFDDCHYPKQWTSAEIDILRNASGIIGKTISQSQTQEQLLRAKEKLEKLHEVTLAMEKSSREEEIYSLVAGATREVIDSHWFTLCMFERDHFRIVMTSGYELNGIDRVPPRGILMETLRGGRSIYAPDVREDHRAIPSDNAIRSALSIPLGGIGVFQIVSRVKNAFSSEERSLSELLISHAGEAIKRIRYEEEIRYMSYHDKLTGLYNRRFLDEQIVDFDKTSSQVGVLMIDLNGLKLVNDAFGHAVGDKLLVRVASILSDSSGPDHLVFRMGGDEFVSLIPGGRPEDIGETVREIKRRVDSTNDLPVQLSLAIGSAIRREGTHDLSLTMREAEESMYRNKMLKQGSFRSSVLKSLERTLFEKSNETEEHGRRLEEMARAIAKKLGLVEARLDELSILARLHDIGKIALPEDIIKKPGGLTQDEWKIMKTHPEIGFRIAESVPELGPVAEGILSHHEHWDGNGYPRGLSGKRIPVIARIISIVDSYDVMLNGRPYKPPMTIEEIVKEFKQCSGTQFDPEIVDAFLEMIESHNV